MSSSHCVALDLKLTQCRDGNKNDNVVIKATAKCPANADDVRAITDGIRDQNLHTKFEIFREFSACLTFFSCSESDVLVELEAEENNPDPSPEPTVL